MSDSEEDEEAVRLGPVECDRLCQEFADITATNSVVAMMFLQRNMWSLKGAVETYYNQFVHGDDRPLSARQNDKSKVKMDNAASSSAITSRTVSPVNKRIKILSWNTDGLDLSEVKARASCLSDCILQEDPDVVFLQEVVSKTVKIYDEKLGDRYSIRYGSFNDTDDEGSNEEYDGCYFTAVCVKKASGTLESSSFRPFGSSIMGRGLQIAELKLHGAPTTVITAHLESLRESATERVRQLGTIFSAASNTDISRAVIVGGDFNLRENEVPKAGGIPRGFSDAWEATGSRKEARWTWDMQRNDNHEFDGKWKPHCRFDRMYFRSADDVSVKPVYFELVGLQRKTPLKRFPSDHFGILFHADLNASAAFAT